LIDYIGRYSGGGRLKASGNPLLKLTVLKKSADLMTDTVEFYFTKQKID